jgi:hypothetical protein
MPVLTDISERTLRGLPVWPDGEAVLPCTSFLNWAADETARLRGTITGDTSREERFQIQNRIATLSAAANGYGQWLYRTAFL